MNNMANLAKRLAGQGTDGRFFSTTKKGETHELRQELNHQSRDKKKSAVKKVIANMTVGKDVSMLFTDVVNCMQTADTQLKKLVYLYLINYAKSNPDLTILAVNTFVKDANDPNPLIRALSVRTMGCIRVDRIIEYLCEPLRRCIQDDDPYVRKTAAICVAKLFDINPDMVEEQGFLDMLRDLISDSNPTVVANAVAALSEIAEGGNESAFKITKSVLQKLLAALNECTEWGQVFVLDALSRYTPKELREAEGIIERVSPRLQHANSAVVLSAIKVILINLEHVTNKETARALSRKMAPPLVTLLSTEPEIQYVALRNINLIVQKRPSILTHEIKVFFCKYNDPIYVKMEKLEIIIRLVSERNIEQVLLEFKEYATEVDVDFVRRSVRAIGQCAIKLSKATERCINVLLELIQTTVNYIVQEAIVVIKDIFRKYPNQYESIIATLCENLDTLDEPEAKASMIWIIGEYAERIDNADELIETFLDGFHDETPLVQLQLLTSTVKLFLKRPNDAQEMVQRVLNMATEESDNPDLRDRGYVYWRLLSSNPDAAKAVVLAEKPTIKDDSFSLEPSLLDQLVANIATLASVYHKLPENFIAKSALAGLRVGSDVEDEEEEEYEDEEETEAPPPSSGGSLDLLDMGDMTIDAGPTPPVSVQTSSSGLDDIFGGPSPSPATSAATAAPVLITEEKGKGIIMRGQLVRENGEIRFKMHFRNQSQAAALNGMAIQVNKSTFGLTPAQQQITFGSGGIPQGSSNDYDLKMGVSPNFVNSTAPPATAVQVATKNLTTKDVTYFQIEFDVNVLFSENGALEKSEFIEKWKGIAESNELYWTMTPFSCDIDAITAKFDRKNVFFIARRTVGENQVAYYSFKTVTNVQVLLELSFTPGETQCQACLKLEALPLGPLFQKSITSILQ